MAVSVLDRTASRDVFGDSPAGDPAPCRVNDPELWFAESPDDVEQAKTLCRGCPVRADCLSSALDRQEPWGVWGGELLLHGVVIPRKRPRGRPRKIRTIDAA